MSSHPANLILRFLLEASSLVALGYWGWNQSQGPLRYLLAVGIPVAAAFLWGTFAVPEDPTRSGKAPIPISGRLRLALELAFFAFTTWALYSAGENLLAGIFAAIVISHYAISYDRLTWLVKQ
jgi:hypothetical protein